MRLFLIGEMMKQHEIERRVSQAVIEAMRVLGIIARHAWQPQDWYTTTALYPAHGL